MIIDKEKILQDIKYSENLIEKMYSRFGNKRGETEFLNPRDEYYVLKLQIKDSMKSHGTVDINLFYEDNNKNLNRKDKYEPVTIKGKFNYYRNICKINKMLYVDEEEFIEVDKNDKNTYDIKKYSYNKQIRDYDFIEAHKLDIYNNKSIQKIQDNVVYVNFKNSKYIKNEEELGS